MKRSVIVWLGALAAVGAAVVALISCSDQAGIRTSAEDGGATLRAASGASPASSHNTYSGDQRGIEIHVGSSSPDAAFEWPENSPDEVFEYEPRIEIGPNSDYDYPVTPLLGAPNLRGMPINALTGYPSLQWDYVPQAAEYYIRMERTGRTIHVWLDAELSAPNLTPNWLGEEERGTDWTARMRFKYVDEDENEFWSDYSNEISFSIPEAPDDPTEVPSLPTMPSNPILDVLENDEDTADVTVIWDITPGASKYEISWKNLDNNKSKFASNVDQNLFTIRTLDKDTWYYFTLRGENDIGSGPTLGTYIKVTDDDPAVDYYACRQFGDDMRKDLGVFIDSRRTEADSLKRAYNACLELADEIASIEANAAFLPQEDQPGVVWVGGECPHPNVAKGLRMAVTRVIGEALKNLLFESEVEEKMPGTEYNVGKGCQGMAGWVTVGGVKVPPNLTHLSLRKWELDLQEMWCESLAKWIGTTANCPKCEYECPNDDKIFYTCTDDEPPKDQCPICTIRCWDGSELNYYCGAPVPQCPWRPPPEPDPEPDPPPDQPDQPDPPPDPPVQPCDASVDPECIDPIPEPDPPDDPPPYICDPRHEICFWTASPPPLP